ncbi:phenylalanine--tRNA ligase subunit beta [Thermogemmatispora sp.]|uniref:phenylalanine--tRNA ligase subunit beta n=1 Tax=Thermogemmatispora sp. TaxID=1968838 RepID=UPI001D969EAA|nr:phenylalanine--tRNA ligase subunit beta [Thermogemmatispora sp.]MBX5450340.1 phenylalanine--tRNA ligase subunit beta [Thermogemmatispora sp.]
MRVPLSWLKEYVEITQSPEELAYTLTMAGLEVEALEYIGANWGDRIITAQITHLEKVPGSDHLSYTRINTGSAELGVICGAPNIKEGDKVPLALPGARIGDLTIGVARKMGYVSEGMLCSPRELGLGSDHSGIYILDPATPLGVKLSDLLSDVVLEFAIKAHRGDLSSVIGIAREVAALTHKPLRLPEPRFSEQGIPAPELVKVTVEDTDLCPRYSARVISGVRIGPSPDWMARRLLMAGMRPINLIVDITNYVMLEVGQPLHAFDYDLVRERQIIVRRAHDGEEITTLDGVRRRLRGDMLLITDPQGPTAIAGVMGSAISEVNEGTTRILLESANFKPASIRRTAVALGLRTESSSRFEKGLDPELTIFGANRAAQLMAELAGGQVHPGIVDVYPRPVEPRTILFSPSEVEWLTGMKVTSRQVHDALSALEFKVEEVSAAADAAGGEQLLRVTVPTFRGDIEEGADLVEEVLRMVGYDQLPATVPEGPLPEPQSDHWFEREYEIREILIGLGLHEILTYAMTSRQRMLNLLAEVNARTAQVLLQKPADAGQTGWVIAGEKAQASSAGGTVLDDDGQPFDARSLPAVTITNPLSTELECMRLTLLSGLMETLQENSKRNRAGLRLFEIGRRYLPRAAGELPEERRCVGIALCGPAAISWVPELARPADFYDLKGIVETLLERLHIKRYRFTAAQHPTFHPGRCAVLEIARPEADGDEHFTPIGFLGEVHPLVQQRYDLPQRAYLCELDLEVLYAAVPERLSYAPISRHQELTRDLAVVVDQQVPARAVQEAIERHGGELLRTVALFDVYTGAPIPSGKKSLTYTLLYQAQDRTLTDAEANALQERIVEALRQEFGATLRS